MSTFSPGHDDALVRAAAQLLSEEPSEEELLVTADGGLRFQRCTACGYTRFPVATVCPECLSTSFAWAPDSGLGTVWSSCVYHRAFDAAFRPAVPYNVALVELDSGPRLISNILGLVSSAPAIGLRVVGTATQVAPGRSLVYFRPTTGGEAP
jgi:uncharacterized OB-fold protein